MERPTMKENLEGYSLEEAHKLYTDCPELYRHIVRLDEYIDNLEDELNKLLISGVSQQRELLLAYESYSANKIVGKEDERVTKQLVEDFLANNCG